MSLLVGLRNKIMEEIVEPNKHQLSVLIVDERTKKIISSCIKLHELADKGICSVERLETRRQILSIHAIYFISPTPQSFAALIDDFDGKTTYATARVFTVGTIPEDLISLVSQNKIRRHLKQLTEIDADFVPFSSHVFSIDSPESFGENFGGSATLPEGILRNIESLVSFLAFLKEEPEVAYYKAGNFTYKFAAILKDRITNLAAEEAQKNNEFVSKKSVILILDRSFDIITPIIHCLRLSSLVYDTNKMRGNIYSSSTSDEIILDDMNPYWVKFRDQHIAEVLKEIPITMNEMREKVKIDASSVTEFADKVKQMPLFRKQLGQVRTLLRIAEDCLGYCQAGGQAACEVEQELVSGVDRHGETIRDFMVTILPVICDNAIPTAVKLRIFFLYVIQKKGISRANVDRILGHAEIPSTDFKAVENLQKLGVKIFDGDNMPEHYYRKCHVDVSRDEVLVGTRWRPCLASVVKETLGGKLNKAMFSLVDGGLPSVKTTKVVSARFGAWREGRKGESRARLIVYVIGGITQSEIAAVNDLNEEVGSECQVVLGSDCICNWPMFLDLLRNL